MHFLGDEAIPNPSGGSMYKPRSRLMQKVEDKHKKSEESLFSAPTLPTKKTMVSAYNNTYRSDVCQIFIGGFDPKN